MQTSGQFPVELKAKITVWRVCSPVREWKWWKSVSV